MKNSARTLIFTGDGKGKSTAALGMALRASGHGLKTLIIQFIKSDSSTGELAACRHLPGVDIVQTGLGFVPAQGSPKFDEHARAAEDALRLAADAIASGKYDLIILDEICTAVSRGLVAEQSVVDAVRKAVEGSCVVMTGRGATDALIELADTVTSMECVKHGYRDGWEAQKGVEF